MRGARPINSGPVLPCWLQTMPACLPVKSLENGSLKVKARVRAGTSGGLQSAPFSQLSVSLGAGLALVVCVLWGRGYLWAFPPLFSKDTQLEMHSSWCFLEKLSLALDQGLNHCHTCHLLLFLHWS